MESENTNPPEPMEEKHSTQIISLIVGALLVVLGLSGMLFSGFAGLHMSILYSMIIAITGGILFYTGGFKNNSLYAFWSCLISCLFFGLHAIAGWIFGEPGKPGVGFDAHDPVLIQIIPNFHELGRNDHILNTVLAVVLLGGALDWWRRHSQKGSRSKVLKQTFNKLVHH